MGTLATRKIFLDKIGSVTKNIPLTRRVTISKKIDAREGSVIAVQVLQEKKNYNQLELVSGRLSILQRGDIVAVALGNRRALKGFVGEVPKKLRVGDIIHMLNLGGVAGVCTSANVNEVGKPLRMKVIGAISDGKKNLSIKDFKLFEPSKKLTGKTPLVVVSGTCMHVGKTTAACEIIKHGSRDGLSILCAKLAGIAALKDTENMKDHGAKTAVSFIDAGFTSTVDTKASVHITKGAINFLSAQKPDIILIEFGDGILGEYGVLDILKDREIKKNIVAHIGCANDPPGAVEVARICKKIGTPIDIVSGPVTDNSVGVDFIEKKLKTRAFNALRQGEEMFEYLRKKL